MEARAGLADALGQAGFERAVDVLVLQSDPPGTRRVLLPQRLQAAADGREVFGGEETYLMEHLSVRDRGSDVIRNESLIEAMILAGGVAQHPLVERLALVP